MDTKKHKKSHCNLTTGQFLFSKYMTIKGLYILNNMCWVFDKKSLIFKIFSKTDISLISFQQLDLNRHYLWNMRVDSRTRLSNRKNIDWICKILDINDIGTSQHSLKSWAAGGQYSGLWEGKTSSIPINMVQRKIINERAHFDHIGGNIVWRQSWSKWTLAAIESKDVLEGHLHIVIWVFPLKHGYDSWKMLSHSCFWMNVRRMHTIKTDYGTMLHWKDIFISLSWVYPLKHDYRPMWTRLNVNECWKDENHQDWLWNKDAPTGHLYIVLFEAWLSINIVMTAFEWILKRCTTPRLIEE